MVHEFCLVQCVDVKKASSKWDYLITRKLLTILNLCDWEQENSPQHGGTSLQRWSYYHLRGIGCACAVWTGLPPNPVSEATHAKTQNGIGQCFVEEKSKNGAIQKKNQNNKRTKVLKKICGKGPAKTDDSIWHLIHASKMTIVCSYTNNTHFPSIYCPRH